MNDSIKISSIVKTFFFLCFVLTSASALTADRLPLDLKKQLLLKQYKAAIPNLEQLALKGNNEARYQLALYYLNKTGPNQTVYQSIKLLKSAANKGHAKAAYMLGTMYYQGDRVEKSISMAKSYLFIAEQSGHRLSKKLSKKIDHLNDTTQFSSKEAQQRLEYAVRSGNSIRAEDALKSGAKINLKNGQGSTPLIVAIRNKQYQFIDWFLAQGPNLRIADSNKNTALHLICAAGRTNLAEKLIKLNAPLNNQNKNGRTPLINAVISGKLNLVKILLKSGANTQIEDKQQKSAFDYAENKKGTGILAVLEPYRKNSSDNKNLQQRLQQLTTQTQTKDNLYYQWPKIAVAVAQNEKQLVSLLLKQGANSWEQNSEGLSAISLAASRINIDYSSLLLKQPNSYSKKQKRQALNFIVIAAKNNNADFIYQISKYLSPKSLTDMDFIQTPIWTAIDSKSEQAALQLIKWQQPDFRADNQGRNLLILAVKSNMQLLSSALLERGFNVNRTDLLQRSSYWYAADRGYPELMKKLITYHVNIHQQDLEGNTPLHRAVLSGNFDAVALTLKQGAEVNKKSKNGNSAIFFAAAKFPKILQLLISNEATISLRNRQSFTPLMNAVKNKCILCIQLLLNADANPSRKNSQGNNSFDLAKGNKKIITLLNQ